MRSSPVAWTAFRRLLGLWMKRRLAGVHVRVHPDAVRAGPLLLCANHGSWWDGWIVRDVQTTLRPSSRHFTVMLERELSARPLLGTLGALGLEPGSTASLRRLLRDLGALVGPDPDATVALFPQGGIWPGFRRPLGFRRGLEAMARALDASVVPVAVHLEPLNRVRPAVFVSVGPALDGDVTASEVERAVEAELDAIHGFLAVHGERAPERWIGFAAAHGRTPSAARPHTYGPLFGGSSR